MPSPPGRWFAVILLQYNLRDPFWDRDAGLFHEGFKANGVDSRFVALGDPAMEQRPDLVLASQPQMEDPAWWRQWNLEGVVLYSWALPRFTRVTRALIAAPAAARRISPAPRICAVSDPRPLCHRAG